MLIPNFETFSRVFPLNASFDYDRISDFLEDVEDQQIIPLLSQEQYDVLEIGMIAGNLDAKEAKLLTKVQRAIACLAFYEYIPFGSVSVNNSGIQQKEDDNNRAPAQWRIRDLQATSLAKGFKAVESFLEYLELYKDDFTAWRDSDSFTVFNQFFLRTAKEMTRWVPLIGSSRILFKKAEPAILSVEEDRITPILGEALFAALQLKWKTPNAAFSAFENKLIGLMQAAIAHLAFVDSLKMGTINLDEKGAFVFKTNNSHTIDVREPAPGSALATLMNTHTAKGEAKLVEVKNYLEENAEEFPAYVPDPVEQTGQIDYKEKTYFGNA